MAYQAVEEIQNRCEKESIPFWKAVQLEDCEENGITEEESWQQMTLMWTRMKESVDAYDPCERSRSGLVGKEGGLMDQYRLKENTLCGDFVSKVIANALKIEKNQVNVKATTEEHLGFTGREEGISSQAICALQDARDFMADDRMMPAGCGACCKKN